MKGKVSKKTTVEVEGLGTGYRLQTGAGARRTERVVVAIIDGMLVEVTYYPDPEYSEYADVILSSVSRDL